jgi:hypothetical protein
VFGGDALEDALAQFGVGHQFGVARGDRQVGLGQHHVHVRQQGGEERPFPDIACRVAMRSSRGPASIQAPMAEPKPYQPGSSRRHWPHEKPQGMARRSSMRLVDLREAGREPRFSSAISAIGVAEKK